MPTTPPKPKAAREVLDAYFLETRAKLIEIAANLDRTDRAPDSASLATDPRLTFIRGSLEILQGPGPNRAEKIQRLYSLPELPRG